MTNYRFQESWATILERLEQNPQAFLSYLERQTELIQEVSTLPKKKQRKFRKLLKRFLTTIWTDSSQLYGRAYVTQNLQKNAVVVSLLISGSTAINTISLFPLVRMAFLSLGSLGMGLSVATTALLLISSNACGSAAAANQPKTRAWSITGSIGFVILNLSLSLVAGPGMELINSQAKLTESKAGEAVTPIITAHNESYESEIANLEQQTQEKTAQCREINERITTLELDHPDRDRLILQTQGRYQDRNLNRSQVPFEDLPLCYQAKVLEGKTAEKKQQYTQSRNALETELAQGKLSFLKNHHPKLYENHFDNEGNLRDNSEAVRLAISHFTDHFFSLEWGELGFSLSFFILSMVTSGAAVALVFAYAWSKSVRQSWNPVLDRMREDLFLATHTGLTRFLGGNFIGYQSNNNVPILPGTAVVSEKSGSGDLSQQLKFLWDCAALMRQTGICTFSPFVRYLERNPEGERLLPHLVAIHDPSQGLLQTDQPDVAISYLRAQISVISGNIATLSRSLQRPELYAESYGDFSAHKAVRALSGQIHELETVVATVERSFPFTSLGLSASLMDDLEYTQDYIRFELAEVLEEDGDDYMLLQQLNQKQLQTYLLQIENLVLKLSTCLSKQLDAGLEPPSLPN